MDVKPQVEAEIGRSLTTAEQAQVDLWTSDAELIIESRLGDLSALNQSVLAMVLRKVVVGMLGRPFGSPDEETEQIDDYKTTRKYVSRDDIRAEWWEMLAPDQTSAAFTIRPSGIDPGYADPVLTRQRVDPYR